MKKLHASNHLDTYTVTHYMRFAARSSSADTPSIYPRTHFPSQDAREKLSQAEFPRGTKRAWALIYPQSPLGRRRGINASLAAGQYSLKSRVQWHFVCTRLSAYIISENFSIDAVASRSTCRSILCLLSFGVRRLTCMLLHWAKYKRSGHASL